MTEIHAHPETTDDGLVTLVNRALGPDVIVYDDDEVEEMDNGWWVSCAVFVHKDESADTISPRFQEGDIVEHHRRPDRKHEIEDVGDKYYYIRPLKPLTASEHTLQRYSITGMDANYNLHERTSV